MKILMAGESWSLTETHTKGFDSVPLCRYEEAGTPLIDALKKNGFDVTYMPNHIAQLHFPDTVAVSYTHLPCRPLQTRSACG